MLTRKRRHHWMLVIAVSAGFTTSGFSTTQVQADDGQEAAQPVAIADPVVIEPVAIEEPSASDAPVTVTAEEMSELPAPASAPCTCCNSTCCTKKQRDAATAKMHSAYQGVFYDNDFSYLNDRCYDGPSFLGDGLKGLAGGNLDIGGELRVRYHSEDNIRGLGLTGVDDEFWLTRYRMYADYQISDNLRFFGEYLYADSGGETFNNRPIEENRGEAQNLFLDVNLLDDGCQQLTGRFGRQELLYGGQRLISPLDWANTRRTFDGYRLLYNRSDVSIDGFYVNPVRRDAAHEDSWDSTDHSIDFYGVYLSKGHTRWGTMDLYYLGMNDDAQGFDYHTLGKRVYGTTAGGWMYETEGGFQFGTNSNGSDHEASFYTAGLGRKLSLCTRCGEWNPTVWLWYDYASGEEDFANVGRGDDGFDHLFPLAHKYNGFMDLFGRRNLHDINAQFITPIMGSKVSLLLWYHYFRLVEQTTPYGVTMQPFNTATVAGDKDLGHEIDILFNININPRNNVLIGYSHFSAGDYYDTTAGVPSNEDADFFYMQYQTQF